MQNILYDYTKRGRDLSSSNVQAAQKRKQIELENEQNAFNPINAAIAAATAYFTGGASMTLPNMALAAASAATAPRGNINPIESGLTGFAKGVSANEIGSVLGEGGLSNLSKLASPENIGAVSGAVNAWQNKPVEALQQLSQPKPAAQISKVDEMQIDLLSNIMKDANIDPASKAEAAKQYSKILSKYSPKQTQPETKQMVTNFPQGTMDKSQVENLPQVNPNIQPQFQNITIPKQDDQSLIDFSGMFNRVEKPTDELNKLQLQAEQRKLQSAPQVASVSKRITSASSENELNKIQSDVDKYMSKYPEAQKILSEKILKAKNDIRDYEFRQQVNEGINEARAINSGIRLEALEDRRAAREQARSDKIETRKMINRGSEAYNRAAVGLKNITRAINIYDKNPSVAGITGSIIGKIGRTEAGQFKSALRNAIDITLRERTGAAVRKDEFGLYDQMFNPEWYNDPENQKAKLMTLKRSYSELLDRLENPDKRPVDLNQIYDEEVSIANKAKNPVQTQQPKIKATNEKQGNMRVIIINGTKKLISDDQYNRLKESGRI